MDTAAMIWIIAVVIVVLIILGLLYSLGRRRKGAANRKHAGEPGEADRLDPDVASGSRRETRQDDASARNPAADTASGSERVDDRQGRHRLLPETIGSGARHQE